MTTVASSDTSHPAVAAGQPPFLPAMVLLFIGSGCAALIYEIVWYQMLQLVIGLTSVSLGVLLGTFMGGMCLGSYLLPRWISTRHHPLRVYAVLELGIGACGVAMLYGFPYVAELYTRYFGYGLTGSLLRAAVAAVCLLPPTLLMGATLPAIARYVQATPQGVSWMGFFYGGNIAGAVFGCLLAGFYLLRVFDIAVATYVALALNVLVAVLGVGLAAVAPYRPVVMSDSGASAEVRRSPYARAAYVAIALSGMSALGAEVVWTRLLSLTLGGTVYTFSIILGVFLAGLGVGSSVGAMIARDVRRPDLALGTCQLLLTLAIAWTGWMIANSLPYWPIDPSLSLSPWYTFQLDMARTFWAIFPATLLWGASFPLALATVAAPGQDPGRLVGGVYAANTIGAIVGALGSGMISIPAMGSQNTQRVLIVIAAVSALIMFAPLLKPVRLRVPEGAVAFAADPPGNPMGLRVSGAVTLLAIIVVSVLFVRSLPAIPWGIIAYGRYMATYGNQLVPGIYEPSKGLPPVSGNSIWCLYEGEGLNGSVVVTQSSYGVRSFHSAGKVQASNDPLDMKLQRMLGHISALAVDEPKSVLVVACGAGVTAGTFLLHPTIEEIYVCDIEELVPKYVAPLFEKENYGITSGVTEQNPLIVNGKKVHVIYDDGRHFIRTLKGKKFDIISSDPIDPWVKGCAALNTVEYYQMCKDHLNPGGVMSLWIPLYEGKLETTKSIISTFFTVFDKGIMWSNDDNGVGYDAVLFGQPEGSHFDVDELQAKLDAMPAVKESLAEVGFHSAIDLLATFAAYAPQMGEWMKDAKINRDRDLRLQYIAGWNFNTFESERILTDILQYRSFPTDVFSGSEESLARLRARMGEHD